MPIRPLSPELASLAETKFGETPEKLQIALREVKEWIEVQPHLRARTDDQWLVSFIRGCKYDMEIIVKKLDAFYNSREIASDFHRLRHNDEIFKEFLGSGFHLPLPNLTDSAAPRVLLVRPDAVDMMRLGVVNFFASFLIIDKLVDDDNSIIAGSYVVIDFKNSNILNLLQLKPIQMKILGHQSTVPFNAEKMFFINIPEPYVAVIDMIKPMMNDTIKSKLIMFTGDYDQMYTHHGLSKDVMPAEYGGNGGTLQDITDHWKRKFEEYNEWLEEDLQFGTDESRRVGGPLSAEELYGVYQNNLNLLDILGIQFH